MRGGVALLAAARAHRWPINALIGASALAVLLADWLTPRGYAEWILYLIPVLLASRTQSCREPVVVTAICTVLVVVGFFLSPPGVAAQLAILNRSLAVAVLWLMAVLLVKRIQAEAALRESHERLQKVLEVETVGVMFWDLTTGCMMDANDTFLHVMGYSRREVAARELTWQKLTPPEYLEMSREEIRNFQTTGRIGPYEKEYLRKDGTRQWFVFAGSSLGHNTCVEFCVDISERKRLTARIEEERNRLASLLNNIPDEIWFCDMHKQFTLANPAALREFVLAGTDKVDVEKFARSLEVFRPDGSPRPVAEAPPLRALTGEEVRNQEELVHTPASGQLRCRQVSASPVRDAAGGIVGSVSVVRDITEHRQAEAALHALAARLERIREEERTRLAREVHDVLGQMLTGLKLDLAWCGRRLAKIGDEELRRQLGAKHDAINTSADAMIETVQHISAALRPGVLDSLGLAAALRFEAEQFAGRSGICCQIAPVSGEPALDADRATGVFRIFQELLTNVARHAQASRVEVALAQAAGAVTLEVRDNGRGATAQELADPRALGILGMRERAAQLSGSLTIHGAPGAGTTAVLTIPLRRPEP
jgi:PAS domain S-box-containing protein